MKKILLLLFIPAKLFAQDFSGTWSGYAEIAGNDYPYDLYIYENNGTLEGFAMTTLIVKGEMNVGIKTVKFEINRKKNILQLEDDELVFSDFLTPPKRVKLFCNLSFEEDAPLNELKGPYRTRSLDLRDRSSFTGKIYLKRVKEGEHNDLVARLHNMKILPIKGKTYSSTEDYAIVEKTLKKGKPVEIASSQTSKKQEANPTVAIVNDPAKTAGNTIVGGKVNLPPAAFLAERETVVIHSYYFSGDSISLSLFDNGTVDGDTVTILLNNKVIIAKKELGSSAIKQTIVVPADTDTIHLVMYAENLGYYPPNTGLLVLFDGKTRNEIRFTGDLENSASIILRRKKAAVEKIFFDLHNIFRGKGNFLPFAEL